MATLEIKCFLTETKMGKIVDYIIDQLYNNDLDSLSDIAEELEGVKVYVDFNIYCNTVTLKDVEIQDRDGDTLEPDTAVLKSRLYEILDDFNKTNDYQLKQALAIAEDRRSYMPW